MSLSGSGISFSGLFSNIDTDAMIEQLINIEKAPIRLLEQKQTKLNLQKEGILDVNNSLLTLKTSLSKLTTSGSLFDNSLTSSDESILIGTADSSATTGTYNVEVVNLAEEQIVSSATKASSYTYGYASNSFTIKAQNGSGPNFTVMVNTGDTLQDIADSINASTGGGGEAFGDYGQAQVITNPATGEQTLVVKTLDTGTDNQFKYVTTAGPSDPLLRLGMITYGPGGGVTEIQSAVDATIKIDGITAQSSTNEITNAIPGVTLNLLESNAGSTIEVEVGLGEDAIISAIEDFVTQFNNSTDLMSGYMKQSPIAGATTEDEMRIGILKGDSDLSSAKSGIRLNTTGFAATSTTTYKILSQIGISSIASSGSYVSDNIEFDEDAFRTALESDKDDVIALLNEWADGLDTYLEEQTTVSVLESDAGNFYRRVLSIEDRIDDIDDDIVSWEDRITSMEDRMRYQFAMMEDALQKMQSQSSYLSTQLSNLSKASSSK